ncbi:MAG: hypothetical protein PPP58_12465 [Natronomonas sp.]
MTAASDGEEPPVELRAHSTCPETTVFTEPGNSDGWIATNYTIDIER